MSAGGYKEISDYGIIGNLRSIALVGRDGSIDWCCFPHLDSDACFGALLDNELGGHFSVKLKNGLLGIQRYTESTNVLKTVLSGESGELVITDFMPLKGNIYTPGKSESKSEIIRILECRGSRAEVFLEWAPRFNYAKSKTTIEQGSNGWIARGSGGYLMSLAGVGEGEKSTSTNNGYVKATLRIDGGQKRVMVCRWQSDDTNIDREEEFRKLYETEMVWKEWANQQGIIENKDWTGKYFPAVIRSELVLKLLTHSDTGAIAAAATTSLPETLGGVRNWDYRYTWIRDAAMTSQALVSVGHTYEALQLMEWMEKVSEIRSEKDFNLQIMYGIHGQTELGESVLEHLRGYKDSRPVHIGNGAASQLQLETHGELLNIAYELSRRGETLSPYTLEFLGKTADFVAENWNRPDHGIWEIRGPMRHYTYSKVMCRVALQRAVHLASNYGLNGRAKRWVLAMERIDKDILEKGYDPAVGAFVQSYESKHLDASNLRIALMEFLGPDHYMIQNTINKTLQELTENGLVYRYLCDDGLPGKEGAFVICTSWLIDNLSISGRIEEATEMFESLLNRANHLGLFSEQIDPSSGEFLGNFPQAFSHIGLINSAVYLAYGQGRSTPEHHPIGTKMHRKLQSGNQRKL
ncbi:glycoside hydrolase family 15 protein [Chitinispirillales bacterium ANBcel5]|uniref:glycoside hydrolase family 15 protein n=1 Tax=Cellulosispirillum alkaliphilum TaxID=3039283 RepID=UPI002A5648FB|nr:glycoside hydrolase family 15 protein [Chitinispirillales bacterium ANBcel5]